MLCVVVFLLFAVLLTGCRHLQVRVAEGQRVQQILKGVRPMDHQRVAAVAFKTWQIVGVHAGGSASNGRFFLALGFFLDKQVRVVILSVRASERVD